MDPTNGIYADVGLDTCLHCGAIWLSYRFEYEHLPASGRWYRGIVPEAIARLVTPESAADVLECLPWWLYGGSYFGHAGRREEAPLQLSR